MTPRKIPRWRVLAAVCVASASLASACGDSDDRPSDEAWSVVWERERQQGPDADTIMSGGEVVCGELLGRLRVTTPDLTPTPSEALDEAVGAWIAHAESIAFDCPTDPNDLADRLDTLDALAAQIDAGLASDAGG